MQTINKTELERVLDENQEALVINVLPEESFKKQHIPGSINIPVKDNPSFVQDVEARAQSKGMHIITYCASTRCDASKQALQKLEEAGFTHVEAYEEGIEGWFGDTQTKA